MQKRNVLRWLLLFLLLCNTFVTLNISIAIVSMVKPLEVENTSHKEPDIIICPNTTFLQRTHLEEDYNGALPEIISPKTGYDWSEAEQNMVLSGYYWLNYISIMLGGILAHKYGSKKVVGFAQVISSTMSSLIPIVAGYGPLAVAWIRAIQGVLSFMSVPAGLFSIMGNWSPPDERGKFGASFALGSYIGLTVGSFMFGYIGQYLHWAFIFHLTSLLGIIWGLLWYFLVSDSPALHPTITIEEKKYIENSLKGDTKTKIHIPWKGIITCVPLLISIFAVNSITWTWVAVTTYFPVYLKQFYGLNSNEIGVITSVPNIALSIFTIGIAYGSDMILRKKLLSVTAVRKGCTFLGGIVAAIPLVIIAFTKCNLILIVFCLMANYVMRAFIMFGAPLVVMDLSPKFCGILEGITGTSSSLLTFAFSSVVNYFTTTYDNESLWKIIFLYTALYGVLANGIFIIFGSAKVQPWNFEDVTEHQPNKEINEAANDSGKNSAEMKNGQSKEIS
ncbi:sodium-dependent phosphate transport protein 3-like [Planococcus citri]|uniref:sodium-dependent phosphate transport protein 3-like n=1 Tax=Planococcus citri TaxID=170843 RepID=UPI0031F8A7D7